MKNMLLLMMILLVTQLNKGAAMSAAKIDPSAPFQIICNHTNCIRALNPQKYLAAWQQAYRAIRRDNITDFEKNIRQALINKAYLITDEASGIILITTLIEYLISYYPTQHRMQMLETLLKGGAFTQTAYSVTQGAISHQTSKIFSPVYYKEHYPPIYCAIITGNTQAFALLRYKDKDVPMCPLMRLWKFKATDESSSISDFLDELIIAAQFSLYEHLPEGIEKFPEIDALQTMLEIAKRPPIPASLAVPCTIT